MKRKAAASPLAARSIVGNLAFTNASAWAWYRVATQRWAWLGDDARRSIVTDIAGRVAALSGHRIRLRITSHPYPADSWAAGLNRETPAPTPGIEGDRWSDHLEVMRRHVARSTMAVKEVYLGVEVATRPPAVLRVTDVVLRRPTVPQMDRATREADAVEAIVRQAGFEATPVTAPQMEWLMRRSLGVGLSAPGALSPVASGRWETEDLDELTESSAWTAEPFANTVHIRGRGGEPDAHAAVLTVGRVDQIKDVDPNRNPWLADTDSLPFPVEWSISLSVLDGQSAKAAVQRKLLVIRDMQRHYRDHDLDQPLALERQADMARKIEDQMTTGDPVSAARVHGWFRIIVTGPTEEKCLQRVQQVKDLYSRRNVTIAHPKGQHGLLREIIPGEPVSSTAYQRRLPAKYFAAGVGHACSELGDRRGPYIGHTLTSSRRAVMFDTHFAPEVRETSGLVPIVGGLGSGKSCLAGLITYEAVRRGITSVMLDPSGPLASLTGLPELQGVSRHLALTDSRPGTLNPYGVVAEPRRIDFKDDVEHERAKQQAAADRKQLARDVISMLLPPSLMDSPDTAMCIAHAIRATEGKPETSLWTVIQHLDQGDRPAKDLGEYLRDIAALPLAQLFFPAGQHESSPAHTDATLTILTMPGLVLPPPNLERKFWSSAEQLSVPLLHLAAWYATKTIYGRPRAERTLVALDEVHFMSDWGAGRALFTRLGRDSRKWNTCVLAASQNPADVLGMEVSNFISAAFVGRLEDIPTAADALRMLRVPTGVGYEQALTKLSPRSGDGRSGLREFVMRDVDGRVDKMRVDLDHLPHVLAALDTTAAPLGAAERIAS